MRTAYAPTLPGVTFDELIARQPTATLDDWRAAAAKQLRGRALSDIDVELAGERFEPYAVPGDASPSAGSYRWAVIADARGAHRCHLQQALEWGAQGLLLTEGPIERDEVAGVRFDFLETYLLGGDAAFSAVVPDQQRADLRRWATTGANDLPGGRLLETSPRLVDAGALADWTREHLVPAVAQTTTSQSLTLRVDLPVDYLASLVLISAVRLLHANVCVGFAQPEPIAPVRILAYVDARPSGGESVTGESFLIDAATRTVAAATAGVDAVVVVPYDDSARQARRALNVQHVLAIEGGFGHTADALAGAAWVEQAAATIAHAAWDRVRAGLGG